MGDLDRLRTFLAIHRSRSMSDAARELSLSQPTVSQQIQTLEAQCGRTLFRRRSRGVETTPAGDELAEQLGSHLDAVEEAWGQWLGRMSPHEGGTDLHGATVYLGGPSEFLTGRVLPSLAPLLAAGVRVRVATGTTEDMVRKLEGRELDLALLTADVLRRGIETEVIAREDFVLVASPDVAAEIGPVRMGTRGAQQLLNAPLLAHAEDLPLITPFWEHVFHSAPTQLASVVTDNMPALAMLAERGIGITVLPRHVCEEHLATGRLVRLVTPRSAPTSEVYLAWRAGSRRTPAIAATYTRIHEVIAGAAPASL
jgi:DNA-binding transcriptional LysR family regulator